jgi:hypothetical protein
MINEKPISTRDAKEAMTKVLAHAHYLPKSWIQNAHLPSIQQEFQSLYQTRVLIVLNELINVIFTPFILMFTMPECVDDIVTGYYYSCGQGKRKQERSSNSLVRKKKVKADKLKVSIYPSKSVIEL